MALLAIYLIFAFAVMEGNVPEDMFLFLPTCAILLCLRLLEKRAISSYLLSGLLEGAIIGFLLFVKANLALIPAGAALFMVVLAIRRKDWKGLAVGVSSGLIGTLLLLAVPIAYYGAIGHLGALLE